MSVSHTESIRQTPETPSLSFEQAGNITITGNDTIGTPGSFTTYYVFGNITIKKNATLNVIDAALTFNSSVSLKHYLMNYGTLIMENSSVILSGASNATPYLNITTGAFNDSGSSMIITNSSIMAYGAINARNSLVKITNSTIASMKKSKGDYRKSLTFSSYNSTVLTVNSTITGLYNQDPGNFTAGRMSENYVSNNEYLSLNKWGFINPDVLIRNVTVQIEYGGDAGAYSYLLFNDSGRTLKKYSFNSTGSPDVPVNTEFNITLTPELLSWQFLDSSLFTVYMSLATSSGDSSTIFVYNITISLNYNNTEIALGKQYFNIVMQNSTFYAIRSGFGLNYLNAYSFSSALNPEKNSILLLNSSRLFFAGSYTTGNESGSVTPFEVHNSSAYIYRFKKIVLSSREGYVNGAVNNITSNLLGNSTDSFVNSLNNELHAGLGSLGINFSDITHNGVTIVPLLVYIQDLSNSSSLYYTGNYRDSVDNSTFYFSYGLFPDLTENESVFNAKISVPKIVGFMDTSHLIEGSDNWLNFSLNALYATVQDASIYVNLSAENESFRLLELNGIDLQENKTMEFHEHTNISAAVTPGTYNVSVTATASGGQILESSIVLAGNLSVYSNVIIKVAASYFWVKPDREVNLTVSAYNYGNQSVDSMFLEVEFFHNLEVLNTTSRLLSISGDSGTSLNFLFSSSENITSAVITSSTGGTIIPYNTSGQSETVNFTQVQLPKEKRYTVEFEQERLPDGMQWSVSLGGISNETAGNYISFPVYNGTYEYFISPVAGYRASVYSGSIKVNGTGLVIPVYWNLAVYRVLITERNLPLHTTWGVFVGNSVYNSKNTTMALEVPNGTYHFSATALSSQPYTGSLNISVNGNNVSYTISFYMAKKPAVQGRIFSTAIRDTAAIGSGAFMFSLYILYRRRFTIPVCRRCGRTYPRTEKECPTCELRHKTEDKNN